MSWGAHVWIGMEPLVEGTAVIPLCQQDKAQPVVISDVHAVPLETSDIPVGSKLKVPEWVCRKCAAKVAELPKTEERQWLYAISDKAVSRYQEKANVSNS